jgi:hypothetical protein
MGLLNGMAFGSGTEFWNEGGVIITAHPNKAHMARTAALPIRGGLMRCGHRQRPCSIQLATGNAAIYLICR